MNYKLILGLVAAALFLLVVISVVVITVKYNRYGQTDIMLRQTDIQSVLLLADLILKICIFKTTRLGFRQDNNS